MRSVTRVCPRPLVVVADLAVASAGHRAGGERVARDKLRLLEEGGVKRVKPEQLGVTE